MTNEEMQKAMEFIVVMEARSSAKIDAITEAKKEADERWARADERWASTEVRIRALLTVVLSHERQYLDRIYREHKRNYRRHGR
jgi:hypothetical protein